MLSLLTKPNVFFVGHGSPMNAVANNSYTQALAQQKKYFEKAKAILVVSAHWETKGSLLTSNEAQKTIHDFGGFPKELFQIQYPAMGSHKFATEWANRFTLKTSESWGLDHGAWSPLLHMLPKPHCPILQLSLDTNKTEKEHYQLAKQMSVLKEENVVLICSGDIVHNLHMINWDQNADPFLWGEEFELEVLQKIAKGDDLAILNYQKIKNANLSVPTKEHFLPLIYFLGFTHQEKREVFYNKMEHGSISLTSLRNA